MVFSTMPVGDIIGIVLLTTTLHCVVNGLASIQTTTRSRVVPTTGENFLSPEQIRQYQNEAEQRARENTNIRIWNSLFYSVPERPDPAPCQITKVTEEKGWEYLQNELPSDFPPGCYLRLGPNGGSPDDGFLDADGMIHTVTFPPPLQSSTGTTTTTTPSKNMYSATYVTTKGRQLEQQYNKKFRGSLGSAPRGIPLVQSLIENMINFRTIQGQKDTANTALAEHNGRILALMEQSCPTEISIDKRTGRVSTVESLTNLNGAIPNSDPITGGALSAHGRTCPTTGERIHVSYASSTPPYARVDIFEGNTDKTAPINNGGGWNLKNSIPIDLPKKVPVMIHDCAITENYVLVLDFPLTMRPIRMLSDRFPLEYEPQHGARIGLVPRNNQLQQQGIRWFDCTPGVILHTINAYEEDDGNKVVFQALLSQPRGDASFIEKYACNYLHEWVLDLQTGQTTEQCLNPYSVPDFPVIDSTTIGQKTCDSVYCINVSAICNGLQVYKTPQEGIMFDGVIKYALVDDETNGIRKGDVTGQYKLPDSWYCVTEPTVVRKTSGNGHYVLLGATKVIDQSPSSGSLLKENDFVRESRLLILDGDQLEKAVFSLDLPSVVPYGLHSLFIEWDKLK